MTIRAERFTNQVVIGRVWMVAVAALWVSVGVWSTAAQDQPAQAGPTTEVRVELLLGSDRLLGETIDDPVWEITATPGRRLIQLPVRITPGPAGSEAVALDKPTFDIPGGRFLYWAVPGDETQASGRRRGRSRSTAQDRPTDDELRDLAALLSRESAEARGRNRSSRRADDLPQFTGGASNVPAEAPRVAREVIITPGADPLSPGRVAWEAKRGIPGGTVKSASPTQPYAYLLDRDQLTALDPGRGERVSRNSGESSREFSARRRQAAAEQRERSQAYRNLQQFVRALPDRFEQDLPETVWAVFEVNSFADEWTLRGLPSGDWTMRFDNWELLNVLNDRSAGRGETGAGDFSGEELGGVRLLTQIAGDPHPWTQALLSTALSDSDLPSRAVPGDPVAQLIAAVLANPDPVIRNRMAYGLAQVDPPTPAAASLLNDAAHATNDPGIQLVALRAGLGVELASLDERNPGPAAAQAISGALSFANTMMADGQGPDAGLVVEQFLAAIPDTPESNNAVVGGLNFDNLPASRFDAAVSAVLDSVTANPAVVGGIVNHRLLGSGNPAVVERTLDLIALADEPAPVVGPVASGLRQLVFGAPAGNQEAARVPMITAGLPLDSANHSLFRLLSAGDPALRTKGWQALRHFELTDQQRSGQRSRRSSASVDENAVDPLITIIDAGLSQPDDTPDSLVPFLARQPDTDRADIGLVRVVVEGDPIAAKRAARVLRGSERTFGTALAELDADARETFANRVYDTLGDGPEPVSGLMRAEASGRGRGSGGVVGWFAEMLAAGTLPGPAAWAEAVGSESALMQAAVGDDENLAAGAFAALTAADGGDRELQFKMIERFKDGRTNKSARQMAEDWGTARQDIFTARLAAAAGDYRLVMTVTGIAPEGGNDGIASDPVLGRDPSANAPAEVVPDNGAAPVRTQRTTLGVTRLLADGRTLRFVSGTPELGVPEDQLAIRIPTVSQLKAFDAAEVKDLPLEDTETPLDLFPEADGRWKGQVMLADGRDFELVMEPWGGVNQPQGGAGSEQKQQTPPASGGELKRRPFGE